MVAATSTYLTFRLLATTKTHPEGPLAARIDLCARLMQ